MGSASDIVIISFVLLVIILLFALSFMVRNQPYFRRYERFLSGRHIKAGRPFQIDFKGFYEGYYYSMNEYQTREELENHPFQVAPLSTVFFLTLSKTEEEVYCSNDNYLFHIRERKAITFPQGLFSKMKKIQDIGEKGVILSTQSSSTFQKILSKNFSNLQELIETPYVTVVYITRNSVKIGLMFKHSSLLDLRIDAPSEWHLERAENLARKILENF